MKRLILYFFICFPVLASGQVYILESAKISFFSEAPLENIHAFTHSAKSIFHAKDGRIAFQIPINTFEFKKSLMQQHFNENFLESDKYPYATFSGKIIPLLDNLPGRYEAKALGTLTIHGVSKEVSIEGYIDQKNGKIFMKAKFPVKLEDFNIKIPKVVFYNIAEVVDVDVEFHYKEKTEI